MIALAVVLVVTIFIILWVFVPWAIAALGTLAVMLLIGWAMIDSLRKRSER